MNAIEAQTDVRRRAPARAKRPRSAVTSGRRLYVDEGDSNSAWSRRYRDLIAGHASDLGGRDTLSAAQFSLVRRASAIECELELMEGRLSKGEQVDLDVFTRSSSHLRRILETLGIERRPRDVTVTLEEFARQIAQEKAVRASQAPDDGLEALDAQSAGGAS